MSRLPTSPFMRVYRGMPSGLKGSSLHPGWLREARPSARHPNARPAEPLVSLLKPRCVEAERYRVLRHSLERRAGSSGPRVIAVSSAGIGDGKTTTAINLAGTMSQPRGSRVLLIDADLRRPMVQEQLGIEGPEAPGLAEALAEPGTPLEHAVRRLTPYNLSVLTAGMRPDSPTDLIDSPRMAELLREARGAYEQVVIDTPPLLAVPDCRLIERHADGVLLVVAAHRTSRRLLEESLEQLEPSKLLGLVLNRDDRWVSEYGAYYSRYYEDREPSGRRVAD